VPSRWCSGREPRSGRTPTVDRPIRSLFWNVDGIGGRVRSPARVNQGHGDVGDRRWRRYDRWPPLLPAMAIGAGRSAGPRRGVLAAGCRPGAISATAPLAFPWHRPRRSDHRAEPGPSGAWREFWGEDCGEMMTTPRQPGRSLHPDARIRARLRLHWPSARWRDPLALTDRRRCGQVPQRWRRGR
jgi:hypothetical protein